MHDNKYMKFARFNNPNLGLTSLQKCIYLFTMTIKLGESSLIWLASKKCKDITKGLFLESLVVYYLISQHVDHKSGTYHCTCTITSSPNPALEKTGLFSAHHETEKSSGSKNLTLYKYKTFYLFPKSLG